MVVLNLRLVRPVTTMVPQPRRRTAENLRADRAHDDPIVVTAMVPQLWGAEEPTPESDRLVASLAAMMPQRWAAEAPATGDMIDIY